MSALLNGGVNRASDGSIRVNNGVTAPDYFQNGLPFMDGGVLAVDGSTAASHYHQGLGFTAAGRIAIKINAAQYYGSGAAPFLPFAILTLVDASPDHYSSGVGYGINNEICVSQE